MQATQAILRLPAVKQCTGLSRSTIYERIAKSEFVPPMKLGGNQTARASGWYASEIAAIASAYAAGWSSDQIQDLVKRLTAARKAAA